MARYRGRHVLGFDLLRFENVADSARHQRRVHDGAVHDGVLRQGLQAKTHEFVALFAAFQLDRLDGTRADVQSNQSFFLSAAKHVETPLGIPATCTNSNQPNLTDRSDAISPQRHNCKERLPGSPSHRHQLHSDRLGDCSRTAASCRLPFFVIRSDHTIRDPSRPEATSYGIPSYCPRGETACM